MGSRFTPLTGLITLLKSFFTRTKKLSLVLFLHIGNA